MTRKIVRTLSQVAAAAIFTFTVLFFLDRNLDVLPNAIHEYMPQHHVGTVITDITIVTCNSMNPFSSCKADAEWTRINKDLFLGKSLLTSGYIHFQKKKEEDIAQGDKVVVDVKVGRLDPSANGDGADPHEEWEQRPSGLWVKLSSKKHASDSEKAVTMVDVLFGEDAVEVREGWSLVGTALLIDSSIQAHFTVRRGAHKEPPKPQPRVRDDKKFRILQVSDLHLSTGIGHCRDAVPDEYNGGKCEADPRTLDFVNKVLDEERPDLVVLSGDQVNGDTAPDAQSAIFKYASLLISRKIPYVSIFGNHDDEGTSARAAQMRLIEKLPYSLSQAGNPDLPGVGNYYIEVLAPGSSKHSAITIYLLDSHSYSPDEKHYPGYDWIKPSQIEWFKETSISLHEHHKEYTFHHINTAFIHIPLPETVIDPQYRVGAVREGVTAPSFNSGFRDALVERNVAFVGYGHDHANEYCALSTDNSTGVPHTSRPELWMCYAGGSGFGGYGNYDGFIRGMRVWDFEMNIGRVKTWKRHEYGERTEERINEQTIVDGARLVGAPEPKPPPSADAI
ncbi:hypothetical protein MKZ38_008964 [Zalerion maritima]|uniref:Calcineurin-like phosphoesterase domain-containing protein n=1 Tax=Zalerion maritima TaxID=339359 RepID=A0AAD5RTS1_9PEZI|nr:hypothetical protein MKZ38_008964 [Zalerion maritima]